MKVSSNCLRVTRDRPKSSTELFKVRQGFTAISLVGSKPDEMKKYARSLCTELTNLFHIVINPSPTLLVDCHWTLEPVPLTMLELKDQWKYVQTLFDPSHNPFGLTDLYKYFDECIIVPERTAKGLIHLHLLARLPIDPKHERLCSDIPRMFWQLFGLKLEGKGQSAIDRFEAQIERMVHVTPVTDSNIVEYLFNKDKKDYEAIMNLKVCNVYCFIPLYLHIVKDEEKAILAKTG